jgi:hypothetical protein
MTPDYRIYPTLLDKFQRLLDVSADAESDRNVDDATGNYRTPYDVMKAEREFDLIDAVNRVPIKSSEAADRGTAFNNVIDMLAMTDVASPFPLKSYTTEVNGRTFEFDGNMCRETAREYVGALHQYYLHAPIHTDFGTVELYGYADLFLNDKIIDIKTSQSYEYGKYGRHWQRYAYPYCAIENGDTLAVNEFDFAVFLMTGGTRYRRIINGERYTERYRYDHAAATDKLTHILEQFLLWLEYRREFITDRRIFGSDERTEGKPVNRIYERLYK